jgi:hypothetical protein
MERAVEGGGPQGEGEAMTESPIEWVRIGPVRHNLHSRFATDHTCETTNEIRHYIVVKTMLRDLGERRCVVAISEDQLANHPVQLCLYAFNVAMIDIIDVLEGKVELPADTPIEVQQ